MRQINYSDEFLTLAARLCYIDHIPQQKVAQMLQVSQAKISRLLAMARERGIVRIEVNDYQPRNYELEQRIEKELALKEVYVIKSIGGGSQSGTGYFGGEIFADTLASGIKIGLAGGRTILQLADGMLKSEMPKLITYVQLMGNVGSCPETTDASEIGRKLAAAAGSFVSLNTPVFVYDRQLRDNLRRDPQIKQVVECYNHLDIALVGVGIPENSIFSAGKVVLKEDALKLKSQGVVGEICGRFFDSQGNECQTDFKDRVMAVKLETLRKIPRSLGIVSDTDRSAAIIAAAKGGIINGLLTNEAAAAALLKIV
ncbi:sugar-binding domain-containing protein [Lentisphaerota bacterium ZTH]|nr:transcriptional regulator [Lentisphaerota bacterium]WET05932.1 sugar-binding domain-containing protein [Lentisphaerota bacterium ZTH]